jgi:GT2 family glycosyltransferase
MSDTPLVYVILVNYNGFSDTIDCLDSLKGVTYSNYETVVVDNASPDGSYAKLQRAEVERGDFVLLQSGWNGNWAGGNNCGIELALRDGAEYVCLLNNDTVVEPEFLSALVQTAKRDERIGLVGGKIYYYDSPSIIWYAGAAYISWLTYSWHHGEGKKDAPEFNQEKETGWVTGCLMLISAEALRAVGKAYEGFFFYRDDLDWSVRIGRKGYKILYQPKSVIYHKIGSTHKGSQVAPYYYGQRNAFYCLFRNFGFFACLLGSCARLAMMVVRLLLSPFTKRKTSPALLARVIADLLKNQRGQVDLSGYDTKKPATPPGHQ